MRYVVLAILGGAVVSLAVRLLLPLVLQYNILFLVLPLLLVATLLSARAVWRMRSGS